MTFCVDGNVLFTLASLHLGLERQHRSAGHMIITCSACSTRYRVDAEKLGHRGRTVRCSNCRHTWFEAAPSSEKGNAEPPAMTEPVTQSDNPPKFGSLIPVMHSQESQVSGDALSDEPEPTTPVEIERASLLKKMLAAARARATAPQSSPSSSPPPDEAASGTVQRRLRGL